LILDEVEVREPLADALRTWDGLSACITPPMNVFGSQLKNIVPTASGVH
jgi:hypothetical protein